ncbi:MULTISPECIES: gamma-glutamyltransferase [Moorena]|uniref:Glutathione hydrolase proenzyme n=2 Tax=Moorena TaxID=1155738 RepID=F4XMT2_9CYAN|nr:MULTISPECIES: gamma-glutamyltransferase [Moorena]EGJ33991.1 gamma-glutamyltransferase 1.threonine peptidase, MEROPS family T03 [Moorena producens 3L]NEP30011.1 gamma-glutamyltransferase [Moorena sp. SIO3B2]NEP65472.1 gamma-glutamyltransferase [Moorena sp. SIO3A5]NEQ10265.1 gamma-glutamyltransferase [Moorena sp. SIO4E2]NER85661.1 gamma-glutamyltransferase [Moorena sp. SIO3A2]
MGKIARKYKFIIICLTTLIFISAGSASAQDTVIFSRKDIFHPVIANNGMVSSQERYASQAGLAVLKEGGNAVDAAVTIGFTLAVTLPRAGNLGGGGFMLLHLAKDNQTIAIDYREKAPLAATRDMFLDNNGEVDPEKSRYSYLSVGVPGTVAGLTMALEKYGTISLERALQPAIELAEKGFPVSEDLFRSLRDVKKRMQSYEASMAIFYKPGGVLYQVGEILVQNDLARSLKLIAKHGAKAFYEGAIASAIVADMEANGGLITKEDLATYKPVIREPIRGTYRGYEIYSMPPPSSGGIHLVQMLNTLEAFPIRKLGHNTAQTIHLMAESMKLAYADRSKFLGDPDFVPVPVAELTSKTYAERIRQRINPYRATPSSEIAPGNPTQRVESNDTTHYSVMDKYGNAVANTYTLNFSYGSKITVPGTGILLNNEMDDFSAKPGVPNAYGLTGAEFNAIAPEKRMLSSMTPTIVLKDGKSYLVTGSPGGSRIITTVLQLIMNVIDHQLNIATATNAIRVHHQWLPDQLFVEQDLNGDTIQLLKYKGYKISVRNAMGSTQSIMYINNSFEGASDPRKPGALTLGY